MPTIFRTTAAALACLALPWTLACANPASGTAPTPQRAPAATPAKKASPPLPVYNSTRSEVAQFAQEVAALHALNPDWVLQTLAQARYLPQVPKLMLPAKTSAAKNWNAYRNRFVEPVRIRAGLRFWQEHEAALERAEREYGVPVEIILGIIGVETIYGRHLGNFRVMDSLSTLAFDFPTAHPRAADRQAYFRRELAQFLSFTSSSQIDPFALRGSYAGAMGLGQFMPSSWVRHAIDFDGDGQIDLYRSPTDAIGSVANYFRNHGWTPGMPTHFSVQFDPATLQLETLLAPDIRPTFTAASMQAQGVILDAAGSQHAGPMALVQLHNGPAEPSYVAGTENFYAITRYNWSSYYALAVIELGRAITAARLQ